jgi:hypothetical protein
MPDLVYKTQTPFVEKGSATLVITCSSNTFYPYIREFLEKYLQLPEGSYDYLSVPGGPQFLMLTEYLPKFAWAGQRWVKFLIEKHRLKKVILITHEDCAWYNDERMIPAFWHKLGLGSTSVSAHSSSAKERQMEHLKQMAQSIHELAAPIAVDAYYAQKETDGTVGFVKVAA